jgi:hypothetical protein
VATRPWTVTPHRPLVVHEDNLWSIESAVPGFPAGTGMDRRMTIVRLGDGRLVFHNAVPVDDATLARVRAWGTPSILIVPMHLHALDAPAFAAELGLATYTSATTRDKVAAMMPVAGTLAELPVDDSVRCQPLAGTKFGEAAYVVESGARTSLLFCDAIQNSRPGHGANGFMFKLMGFTGSELKAPPFYKLRAVSDKAALRRDLARLAETPSLARIIPSHGLVVDENPAAALRTAVAKYY